MSGADKLEKKPRYDKKLVRQGKMMQKLINNYGTKHKTQS